MKPLAYAIVLFAVLAAPLVGTSNAEPGPQADAHTSSCIPAHVSPDPPYVWVNEECVDGLDG
jgi:hypothetical protein